MNAPAAARRSAAAALAAGVRRAHRHRRHAHARRRHRARGAARAAMRCATAGLPVIAITGRPMGWSEPFARDWPVDAIVAENGAVALFTEGGSAAHRIRAGRGHARAQRRAPGARSRSACCARCRARRWRATAPAASPTSPSITASSRSSTPSASTRVVAIMRARRHECHGQLDPRQRLVRHARQAAAARAGCVQRLLGRDVESERDRWVYVGDSTNDQLMFEHFPLSVGVANLMRFAEQLTAGPPGSRKASAAAASRSWPSGCSPRAAR